MHGFFPQKSVKLNFSDVMELIVRFLSIQHLNVVSNNETAMLCLAAYIFIRHIANLPFDKEPIEFINILHGITNRLIINNNSMEFCYHQSWYSTFSSETRWNCYNFYIKALHWMTNYNLNYFGVWFDASVNSVHLSVLWMSDETLAIICTLFWSLLWLVEFRSCPRIRMYLDFTVKLFRSRPSSRENCLELKLPKT